MQAPLTKTDQETLLRIARQAVEAAASNRNPPPIDTQSLSPALREPGATFVTLYNGDQLRGCIGTLTHELPLAEDVRIHAVAAATRDHRFPPIQSEEVSQLEIDISVLSTPQPVEFQDGDDLLKRLRPGEDGVIVEQGSRRATFLPQVWKKIPDPKRFMEMLCEKAFLPRDAWRSRNLRVHTYQVLSIRESEP